MRELIGLLGGLAAVFAFVAVVVIAVDRRDSNAMIDKAHVNTSCIDGVEYYTRSSGYQGYIAPRVDPDTLTFVNCNR